MYTTLGRILYKLLCNTNFFFLQEAFSHLLGDQNELTQELASQGMSIVYELGDSSMKQSLVDALVNTLTGTSKRKRAIKVYFIQRGPSYGTPGFVFGPQVFFYPA